jgi:acetyl esterase/lipase
MDYRDIVLHCGRAVQFIRSKAKKWNIDPKRIVCSGVSAGALISEFLAYHDDLADPKSDDPVGRLSTRPAVVVSVMQPIGTKEFAIRYMDKGEAPIFIYSNARPDDRIHPPSAAILIRDKAKELNIPHACYSDGRNEIPSLPKDQSWLDFQLKFCKKHLPPSAPKP